MNVSLPPELEDLVNRKVKTGMYHSASEVISESLRLLQEQEALKEYRLSALRQEIAIGIEQADRGDLAPFDAEAILAEGRRHLAGRDAK